MGRRTDWTKPQTSQGRHAPLRNKFSFQRRKHHPKHAKQWFVALAAGFACSYALLFHICSRSWKFNWPEVYTWFSSFTCYFSAAWTCERRARPLQSMPSLWRRWRLHGSQSCSIPCTQQHWVRSWQWQPFDRMKNCSWTGSLCTSPERLARPCSCHISGDHIDMLIQMAGSLGFCKMLFPIFWLALRGSLLTCWQRWFTDEHQASQRRIWLLLIFTFGMISFRFHRSPFSCTQSLRASWNAHKPLPASRPISRNVNSSWLCAQYSLMLTQHNQWINIAARREAGVGLKKRSEICWLQMTWCWWSRARSTCPCWH